MSNRIIETDICKGIAGFLMVMAHIAGKGMLPFGNFGAALFFVCSGMNTALLLSRHSDTRRFGYFIFFSAALLFFGGFSQIKIAHPKITVLIPEFLQFAALAVILLYLVAKFFKNPFQAGYLFAVPFILHLFLQWIVPNFSQLQIPWKGFFAGGAGFSLIPWSGFFLYGVLLLYFIERPNVLIYLASGSGLIFFISFLLFKQPLNKFNMSLPYISLGMLVITLLFILIRYLCSLKGRMFQSGLNWLAIGGRNSLMLLYLHYAVIYLFRTKAFFISPLVTLLLRSVFFFCLVLLLLFIYEKVKYNLAVFYLILSIGLTNIILRYFDLFHTRVDLKIVDMSIGLLFAFFYVQVRYIFKIKIGTRPVSKSSQ